MSESPKDKLKQAVHVPNLGPYGDPKLLVELAVLAEEAGGMGSSCGITSCIGAPSRRRWWTRG